MWKQMEPDVWKDDFGILWDQSKDKDIGVVVNKVINPDNVNLYKFLFHVLISILWVDRIVSGNPLKSGLTLNYNELQF